MCGEAVSHHVYAVRVASVALDMGTYPAEHQSHVDHCPAHAVHRRVADAGHDHAVAFPVESLCQWNVCALGACDAHRVHE